MAAVRSSLPHMQTVTWERVRDETSRDIHLLKLMDMAEHGFPETSHLISQQLMPYWRFGVISCRWGPNVWFQCSYPTKVAHLHSAHQGVSQMNNRS